MRRIEEEGAKNRYVQAVRQNGQVRLCELERWRMLMHQLHAVQEEQEHGSLRGDKTLQGWRCATRSGAAWSSGTVQPPDSCLSGPHALGSTFQVTAIPNCIPSAETNMLD